MLTDWDAPSYTSLALAVTSPQLTIGHSLQMCSGGSDYSAVLSVWGETPLPPF